MKKQFHEIQRINKLDNCVLSEATNKLAEEFGELVQVINMTTGRKISGLTSKQIRDNVIEECADVIQNVFCIAGRFNIKYKDLSRSLSKKNKKWRKYIKKKKLNLKQYDYRNHCRSFSISLSPSGT